MSKWYLLFSFSLLFFGSWQFLVGWFSIEFLPVAISRYKFCIHLISIFSPNQLDKWIAFSFELLKYQYNAYNLFMAVNGCQLGLYPFEWALVCLIATVELCAGRVRDHTVECEHQPVWTVSWLGHQRNAFDQCPQRIDRSLVQLCVIAFNFVAWMKFHFVSATDADSDDEIAGFDDVSAVAAVPALGYYWHHPNLLPLHAVQRPLFMMGNTIKSINHDGFFLFLF